MVFLQVAILISLALHCTPLTINVVVQLRDRLRVGGIPSSWDLGMVGSSVSIAIEDFQAKGFRAQHTFR